MFVCKSVCVYKCVCVEVLCVKKEFDLIWGRFDLIWGRVCVNICRANLVFHYHISMVSPHYVTVVVV
jgi:hypothetical protein